MKAEVPQSPVVFLKPSSAIVESGGVVVLPPFSTSMHHEVELVVLIGRIGRDIPRARAWDHVAGYGVGLDMTLRDVQAEAKAKGLPWTVAKGFDTSAPVSRFTPRAEVPDPHTLGITLEVNGATVQHGSTADMIWQVDELVTYLSSVFTLEEGDLIFTGTPEGVGPVQPGDRLHAVVDHVGTLDVTVQSPPRPERH